MHSAAKKIHSSNKKGGKVIIVGNGGSGIANHATMDFTKVAGYRAVNLMKAQQLHVWQMIMGMKIGSKWQLNLCR